MKNVGKAKKISEIPTIPRSMIVPFRNAAITPNITPPTIHIMNATQRQRQRDRERRLDQRGHGRVLQLGVAQAGGRAVRDRLRGGLAQRRVARVVAPLDDPLRKSVHWTITGLLKPRALLVCSCSAGEQFLPHETRAGSIGEAKKSRKVTRLITMIRMSPETTRRTMYAITT